MYDEDGEGRIASEGKLRMRREGRQKEDEVRLRVGRKM